MLRLLLICALSILTMGCGGGKPQVFAPAPQLVGLPSPSQLAATAPPARSVSGSHATLNRTFVGLGNSFVPFAGWSSNAESADANAKISGATDELSFVFYQVGALVHDNTELLAQIQLDYQWQDVDPSAPHGLFIGLPDQANDRWIWTPATDARGNWLDVSGLNLMGVDPVTHPNGSYIAVVNFSETIVNINRIALRVDLAGATLGDEWIYYTSKGAVPGFSVSRASLSGGLPEVVHQASATHSYAFPAVVHYHGDWELVYAQMDDAVGRTETWMSNPDGSGSWQIGSSGSEHVFPAGWDYASDRGLFLRTGASGVELLAFYDTFEFGRLSDPIHSIGKAVWNTTVDTTVVPYSAIASVLVDEIDQLYHIAMFAGYPPFPIDADPISLFTRGLTEDARDPEILELANLGGDPRIWAYCANRNRDDSSYNLYRLPSTGTLGAPERVLVDAAFDYRYPALSRDGRWLAFMRQPWDADPTVLYELVVVDMLNPTGPEQVLATDAWSQLSWYDPTP